MIGMESLELKLSLQLLNSKERPSFVYLENDVEILAMIYTGAKTPVWCKGKKKFKRAYPNAVKQDYNCAISGFGKEPIMAEVYYISRFTLTDEEKQEYTVKGLYVAVCNHPIIGYDFILSNTLFSKADILIYQRKDHKAEFVFDKHEYQCAIKHHTDSFSIAVFSQE